MPATDRTGQEGYNPGDDVLGDDDGHYTNAFGGTSSACPGAAGGSFASWLCCYPLMVHDKFGGGTNNIKRTFDTVNTPELATLMGKNPLGEWMLEVIDTARADTGKIRKFTVELGF